MHERDVRVSARGCAREQRERQPDAVGKCVLYQLSTPRFALHHVSHRKAFKTVVAQTTTPHLRSIQYPTGSLQLNAISGRCSTLRHPFSEAPVSTKRLGVSSLRDGGYARQYNAERHIPPAEVSGVTGELSPGHAGCEHEARRKHGRHTKSHNSHVAQQGLQYVLRQVSNLQGKTRCISGAFSRLKSDSVVW